MGAGGGYLFGALGVFLFPVYTAFLCSHRHYRCSKLETNSFQSSQNSVQNLACTFFLATSHLFGYIRSKNAQREQAKITLGV